MRAPDEDEDEDVNSEGPGCFTFVLGVIALWALLFGVTVGGKHYGLRSCSCDRGVEIDR